MAVFGTLSGRTDAAHVFLTDHNPSYSLSLSGGLRRAAHARQDCDVVISSESLALCFKLPCGGETLRINGRFEAPPNGREYRFFNTFRFGRSVNLGMPMAWGRLATAFARRMPVVGRLVAGNA
jgi:hypothetical protein